MNTERWKRFSLRTLLVLMTLACVMMGVWTLYIQPFRRQAQAAVSIERSQGMMEREAAEGPGWQEWLVVKTVGPEHFVRVTMADLRDCQLVEGTLQDLRYLCFARQLYLDKTEISEELLEQLVRLKPLEKLSIRFTNLSDSGVASLSRMENLRELALSGTRITDASIAELGKMKGLQSLNVRWSSITPQGAERLRQALPECQVYYHDLAALE